MKKSGNRDDQKRSIFERYSGEASPVRHVETPVKIPGADDLKTEGADSNYGQAEDMRTWGLDAKQASVRSPKRNVFIGLGIAVGVIILMLAGIFFILPRVLPGLFKGTNIELFVQKQVNYVYTDPDYRVIIKPAVSVYQLPDVTSDRVTQVLYNEAVTLIGDDSVNGFIKIRTGDGMEGYIDDTSFIDDMSSVEPDLYKYKLVISNPYKNIMTHASNGTLITKAMMNTTLYGNVKRDGVYQVNLPGGDIGWIGSSGVIEIGTRDKTDIVSSRYFVSSVLTFVNSMYLDDGLTMQGASVNGIAYVCSSVNGIELPRSMEEQAKLGTEIPMEYDAVNRNLIVENILPGDLVFLRGVNDSEQSTKIAEMAICTDTGTFFMISPARTTVRLKQYGSGNSFYNRIITVRRFFEAD
ncbi:SH3 domain-containing protein [Ruminococcaceae bacterium YRB3002]|nr:SH3 domain-containing protein [Ruminococcaceae bacterium YRB3002]